MQRFHRPAHLLRRPLQLVVRIAGIAALALAAALAASPRLRADVASALAGADGASDSERVRVDHAIDGDTLVTADGRTIRVIGIDTPETHHPDMAGHQPLGPEAAARLAALVDGRPVRLERDSVDVDDYGRLLRHVWVGGRLVGSTLVAEGLAHVLVIPPNVGHEAELRMAEAAARAARRGLWGIARPTGVAVFATPADAAGAAAPKAAASIPGSPLPTTPLDVLRLDAMPLAAFPSLATPAADGAVDLSQPCGARVAGAIPAESAGDHLDTFQAVEFEVVRAKDTGKVTFLNSHDPFQGFFYAAVFPTDYAAFPAPPAEYFAGKCIVVQGRIELYRGAPQIVVRGAEDVRMVDGPRP